MKESIELFRRRVLRRYEFWIIVVACIVAAVLLGIGGCARVEPSTPGARADAPQPSPVVRSFQVASGTYVIEFRDSAGRICVLVRYFGYGVALDCGRPLPPLDYEQLPEPAVTRIPLHGYGLEKRPL